jgi:hypothetical protein
MNELNSGQPADRTSDTGPLPEIGSRTRDSGRDQSAYRETPTEQDNGIPTVKEGMAALARYERARGQLAESRTRQDVAAEDRAWSQRAGPEATSDNKEKRTDVASQYPAEYVPSVDAPPKIDGPHQSPETWIDDINPGGPGMPGKNNNCGECSRAVDTTWGGKPTAAAALADPYSDGEPTYRMTEWVGTPPVKASLAEIGRRLAELGPGSSAVVGCDWRSAGGHWFNAINDGGTVKAVDGQRGRVEIWPPSVRGFGFDESIMRSSDAIFFTADGKTAEE